MDRDEEIKSLRHALYGIFFAMSSVLPSQEADFINEVLLSFQDDPDTSPTERLIYGVLTDSHRHDERPRPQLVVNNA